VDPTTKFAGLPLLAWIPVLPLLGALINLTIGRRLSRQTVHTIAIAAVVGACALSLFLVFGPLWAEFKSRDGVYSIEQNVYTWIEVGAFKVPLALRLDTLSSVMILVVTFVGSLIHIYSTGYMAHEPRYAAYFGYLNLFMGSMLILVLASNMPVMFIGWEGVGLCSFLLIGFWFEKDEYAAAGRKAFVVNRIGDFAFLLGMFLLFWATKDMSADALFTAASAKLQAATDLDPELKGQALQTLKQTIADRGSLDFANLANPAMGKIYVEGFWGGERLAAAAGILLFIGACGKSAQLPLHVWLPDAMAGPTPVSALIHAATMVTAGVYMVCRLSFLYSSSTTAMIVVATVGLITALAAAFMAMAQTDLKKVLAYSTVSQLGFMFVAVGTGNWVAAIFHLGTHAFFKACLFLGAGSVMHGMEHGGSATPGDIMQMGGLRKHMPITRITFMVSCLAIAGILPFAGFFSKDEILGGAFLVNPPGWPAWYGEILWIGLLVAALGTAFYMWRLYFLVFSGDERSDSARKAHESPASMTAPLVVLAVLATISGAIGLPHLSIKLPAFTHALATWIAPSVVPNFFDPITGDPAIAGHASDTMTFILMGVALAVGAAGIGLAWLFYGRGPTPTLERLVEGPLAPLYRASKAKLWFDEIYDVLIVRPFRGLARGLYEIVDRFIIDTIAVTGAAFVIGLLGRVSRWFQNGQVQRYLSGLVVGAAAVFFITDCKTKPTFEYKRAGDMIELHASPGAGVVGKNSKLTWDITGDELADNDATGKLLAGPDVTVRAGDITSPKVTLIIEDPVTRKTVKVTRVIELAVQPDEPQEGK